MEAHTTSFSSSALPEDDQYRVSHSADNENVGSLWPRSTDRHHRGATGVFDSSFRSDEDGSCSEPRDKLLATHSSSESGTEADDERGRLLKGLPAPLGRPHKGLRGAPVQDGKFPPSPLATPLLSEKDSPLSGWFNSSSLRDGLDRSQRRDAQLLQKFTQRRRLQCVRRTTEILLFIAIGLISTVPHLSKPWLTNRAPGEWPSDSQLLPPTNIFIAITASLMVIILFYLSYPIRSALTDHRLGWTIRWFQFSSKFDVAPFLYPVLMPLLVSISLGPTCSNFILPNLVLSLSSLPPVAVPFSYDPCSLNTFQWLVTIFPCASESTSDFSTSNHESLVLLYPLHYYTVLLLSFLTMTSLDTAELYLLGTILVNLWFFASSPQSQIMKDLLWLGTISMMVFCHKPLQWELALARIPAWRFGENDRRRLQKGSFFQRLDRFLCERLMSLATKPIPSLRDDSDDYEDGPVRNLSHGSLYTQTPQNFVDPSSKLDRIVRPRTTTSLDRPQVSASTALASFPDPDPPGGTKLDSIFKPQRRHTLTVAENASPEQRRTTPGGRLKRSFTLNSQPLLTLGTSQASVRKVTYAVYIYAATLIVILGPIRLHIQQFALGGSEPFGWALGYLFGDIRPFRNWVLSMGLDKWIALPHETEYPDTDQVGWIEATRQNVLGPATTRLIICGYCMAVLLIGLATVQKLQSVIEVDTCRKIFHGTMVAMFLPTILIDPCFIALALMVVLVMFLLLEVARASQIPPIAKPLSNYLAPFVDGRDHRGPVVVSHIFLLVGCAIPLWLSLASLFRKGETPWEGWDVDTRDVSMVSGVICVGMGDSAASLVGRRFGRHKWYWGGGKSVEGSVAFAFAVTTGLAWSNLFLHLGGWSAHTKSLTPMAIGKAIIAASGASLLETVLIGANDNVVVPVVLWLLIRGLEL